jgi:hypothetical protein
MKMISLLLVRFCLASVSYGARNLLTEDIGSDNWGGGGSDILRSSFVIELFSFCSCFQPFLLRDPEVLN